MNQRTDDYGNPLTESGELDGDLMYCCFPDCGCDGARLCMAKNGASSRACSQNVEGMWSNGSKPECRKAVFGLIGSLIDEGRLK